MSTVIFEFGWFGFGRPTGGLFPAVCIGIVRVSWCRGLLADAIKRAVRG